MSISGKVVRLMDKGIVVDIGNNIEGFVPISQLDPEGKSTPASPADVVYETMNLDMKVMEVDPIHRRIVLGVTNIPTEQPPRPAEPSKIESMDALENPPVPPVIYDIDDSE
jgi:small subunit ribosomal protein S1